MMLKEFDLDNYLFGITESELSDREIKQIKHQLKTRNDGNLLWTQFAICKS